MTPLMVENEISVWESNEIKLEFLVCDPNCSTIEFLAYKIIMESKTVYKLITEI